ncbi:hypothetical protein SERLA73DRAFT_71896 [Serpula lacrymans var. lacrymans S7.3]|uniref:Uncharacterized protein n=1 Tax=Serpula lacrymans var. lacrymans (strain S7.3) TaxID=936435 RepID=F8PT96_SERL3|nr:hypothetical protein SERLA73DRAFT_71896 [Serpula lacrymans var. lacrymans S7.3]
MARIDENQEAIAHIRMTVDNYDKAHHNDTEDQDLGDDAGRNDDQRSTQPTPDNHWMLGSPTNLTSSVVMEHCEGLKGFDKRLRSFLVSSCNVAVGDGPISIRKYQCIYLKYQSHEDWSEGRDILRCNPNFNKESRFDCVLINTDTSEPVPARLQTVFRCFLQSSSFDIVSVKIFKPSNGIPRTRWSGALLYDEARDFKLVMAKSLIRGAHMIEAFDLKEGFSKKLQMICSTLLDDKSMGKMGKLHGPVIKDGIAIRRPTLSLWLPPQPEPLFLGYKGGLTDWKAPHRQTRIHNKLRISSKRLICIQYSIYSIPMPFFQNANNTNASNSVFNDVTGNVTTNINNNTSETHDSNNVSQTTNNGSYNDSSVTQTTAPTATTQTA